MSGADHPPAGMQIAGFWRRVVALAIDCAILGAAVYLIGRNFEDQLIALGQAGRIVGFFMTLAYFGLGDSAAFGGRTIGKALLGVRVVDASSAPVSFARAVWRTAVFALPIHLNGVYFASLPFDDAMVQYAGALLLLAVFGFGGASLYLFVFNRRTRQALHDLFADTYVVRAAGEGAVEPRVWTGHVAIVLAWFALVLASPVLMLQWASAPEWSDTVTDTAMIQRALREEAHVDRVQVEFGQSTFVSTKTPATTTTFLSVEVRLTVRPADAEAVAREVAAKVLKLLPDLGGRQVLIVQVTYGYELGIVNLTNTFTDQATPDEWRKKLTPDTTKPSV